MSLLSNPDNSGDEEIFKTISRAFQILPKDTRREVHFVFRLEKAKKFRTKEN